MAVSKMISLKKLIKIARKWKKIAVMGRKNISYPRAVGNNLMNAPSSSAAAPEKGTFVVYTDDQSRFALPLAYLSSSIFQELFLMSEEEFGVSSTGPIVFPCDSLLMNYIVSLCHRGMTADLERALLNSVITNTCSASSGFHQQNKSQPLVICGC